MGSDDAVRVTIIDSSSPDVIGRSWITKESGEHIFDDDPLTFDRLRDTNVTRCDRWHHGFPRNQDGWNGADWSNAMQGEVGELTDALMELLVHSGQVGNLVKKLRRVETELVGNRDKDLGITWDELRAKLAAEAADVTIYLDLLMCFFDLDLGAAVAAKFNKVSEELGFPERL